MLENKAKIIDVHQHIFPEFYIKTMKEELGIKNCGGAPWPKWSAKAALKIMDKKGIEKGFLSYSLPGVYFKNDKWSGEFARKCNDYLAEIVQKYPSRFGGFAVLPLPDADGALKELEYSKDILKLDGIGLLSNVNGVYPGTEKYRNLFRELNERSTVVFIHPNNSVSKLAASFHDIFYGWFLETSKALIELAKSGYLNDYPQIKYILAHAGGVYPAFSHLLAELKEPILKGNIYVDTAKAVDFHNLNRLLSVIPLNHIVFGSDYPMANGAKIDYWLKNIHGFFSDRNNEMIDILQNNVQMLFPSISKNLKEVLV